MALLLATVKHLFQIYIVHYNFQDTTVWVHPYCHVYCHGHGHGHDPVQGHDHAPSHVHHYGHLL